MCDKKIVDYFVLKAGSAGGLRALVLTSTQNGWKTIGGVSISHDPNHGFVVYAQAIVKYEEENKNE